MEWVERVRGYGARFRRSWDRTGRWRDHLYPLLGIVFFLVLIAWLVDYGRPLTVPDVEGVNMHRATLRLQEAGIDFEAEDVYGIVTRQWPRPGDPFYRWQDVTLTYEYLGEELTLTSG